MVTEASCLQENIIARVFFTYCEPSDQSAERDMSFQIKIQINEQTKAKVGNHEEKMIQLAICLRGQFLILYQLMSFRVSIRIV